VLSEGQTLNDTYRLLRVVAQGGMGVVYEATHARLAGRYAIKVLTPQLAESPEGLAQFDREARITSLLQHPNIVQVIDHNTAPDGTEYLVMEYLAGESLSQRLAREGRLSLDTVVDIVGQIAAGLSAAHAHRIVHRDLKPDNVVLVPVEGRQTELVKILDFGVSKRHGSLEMSGLVCGTPQYMAPEQVEGRILDINASTDQFALAVIAQELLTGRNPFAGGDVVAIFSRVSSDPPMPAGFGTGVDAVLARALAKSGRLRFRSVADFSEAFRAAALAWGRANEPVATVPATDNRASDLEAKPRLRRRNGRIALGAGAMVIAMVLLAVRSPNRLLAAGRAASAMVAAKLRPDHGPREPVSSSRAPVSSSPPQNQPLLPAEAASPEDPPVRTRPQPARIRPRSHATASRPRPALTVDEDATMPLTEMSGYERNP
jgi:serine/threonine protein kinase